MFSGVHFSIPSLKGWVVMLIVLHHICRKSCQDHWLGTSSYKAHSCTSLGGIWGQGSD